MPAEDSGRIGIGIIIVTILYTRTDVVPVVVVVAATVILRSLRSESHHFCCGFCDKLC